MNTEQLRYLVHIRQYQSISQASRELYVSEQMIGSRHREKNFADIIKRLCFDTIWRGSG